MRELTSAAVGSREKDSRKLRPNRAIVNRLSSQSVYLAEYTSLQVWRLLELGNDGGGGGEPLVDLPAPDGTTAIAMAVGHMNAEIAALILTAKNVEPKDKITFIAEEVLKTENKGDKAVENFKNSMRELVGDREVNNTSERRQSPLDLEMVELSKRFPYVNEEAEMARPVNKSNLEKMLRKSYQSARLCHFLVNP